MCYVSECVSVVSVYTQLLVFGVVVSVCLVEPAELPVFPTTRYVLGNFRLLDLPCDAGMFATCPQLR